MWLLYQPFQQINGSYGNYEKITVEKCLKLSGGNQ